MLTDPANGAISLRRPLVSKERLAAGTHRAAPLHPAAVRSVGVMGGKTAGRRTALALVMKRPSPRVSLVETLAVSIIGEGESSSPLAVTFPANYVGVEPANLYGAVQLTWKLRIRFDRGGHLEPHTTATTMNAGWRWNILARDKDHLGFVFPRRHRTVTPPPPSSPTVTPDTSASILRRPSSTQSCRVSGSPAGCPAGRSAREMAHPNGRRRRARAPLPRSGGRSERVRPVT